MVTATGSSHGQGDPRWQPGSFAPAGLRALLADRLAMLRALGLVPRRRVMAVGGLLLFSTFSPTVIALFSSVMIEAIRAGEVRQIIAVSIWLGAGFIVGEAATTAASVQGPLLARYIDDRLRASVRSRLVQIEARALDAPTTELVAEATVPLERNRRVSAGDAAVGFLVLIVRFSSALVAAALLIHTSWILAVGIFLGCLTIRAIIRRQWMHLASIQDSGQSDSMISADAENHLISSESAREVKVFSLGPTLIRRWSRAWSSADEAGRRAHRAIMRRQTFTTTITALVLAAALLLAVFPATQGASLASVARDVLLISSVMAFSYMGPEAYDLEYGRGPVRAYSRLSKTLDSLRPSGRDELHGIIRFQDASFAYRPGSRESLSNFSLELPPRQVVAVVGPNGSGKSTLLMLLSGQLSPTSGSISVGPENMTPRDLEVQVVLQPQDPVRYPMTVRSNLAPASWGLDDSTLWRALDLVELKATVGDFPRALDTLLWAEGPNGRSLSGGQWQKLILARTLLAVWSRRPAVVALDEPTSHMDDLGEESFVEKVLPAFGDAAIIVVTHRLSTARRLGRIVVLDHGRLVAEGDHHALTQTCELYASHWAQQARTFLP